MIEDGTVITPQNKEEAEKQAQVLVNRISPEEIGKLLVHFGLPLGGWHLEYFTRFGPGFDIEVAKGKMHVYLSYSPEDIGLSAVVEHESEVE